MRLVTATFCATMVSMLLLASFVQAQTVTPPKARIHVLGVSGEMLKQQIPGMDKPSNGLPNVAKGDKVYLRSAGVISLNSGATKWASASFSFTDKPSASTATFERIDDVTYFFIPDEEGTYVVEMDSEDDAGQSGTATVTVNVGKYVGIGGIVGSSATPPECRVCHSAKAAEWEGTMHARAIMPIDYSSNFAAYCLPCHTTGSPNADAEGDGWAHRARVLGWTFPSVIQAGNWDDIKANFPELAKMANVQCESCHGPSGSHGLTGNKADNRTAISYTAYQCRQCHDAPDHHPEFQEYDNAAHSTSMTSGLNTESMNRGNATNTMSDCARCHTANGHVEVHIKGAQFSSAPYANPAAVTCIACHDPHANNNPAQLRKPVNESCIDCHSIRPSGHSGLHSSHQGPMIKGEGGAELPGYTYRSSAHSAIDSRCVQCHMAAPEEQYKDKLGGHTFKVMYDNDTPDDVSDDVINQTGCIECHTGGVALQSMHETQDEIRALLDELKSYLKLRADGRPLFQMDPSLSTTEADLHYNWYFVTNDNSFGVHNYLYSKDLLTASIAVAKTLNVEHIGGPRSFALEQNYPNPFNPSTTIRFSIPTAQDVTISIFDASGTLIYTLVNNQFQAGTYSVQWNGTRGLGESVPSGVYFYRISAGEYNATKKMMLVK
jgi:predicted CXXCH cytochrome family protein